MASTPRSEMPLASATMLEAWIVPPSAIGSLKGTPSSTTSTPAACMASSAGTVSASRGKPAVRYATKAGTPRARAAAKAAERRAAMDAAQGWAGRPGGRGQAALTEEVEALVEVWVVSHLAEERGLPRPLDGTGVCVQCRRMGGACS
jgi:hypothetical protein